ncbi:MAG: plasmid stabilization protein [Rhodobacteraceae bacterium]|nr:plasmid stabilization protein [Paracoccaceae bacterium]
MESVTDHNLDDHAKARQGVRAADNGYSIGEDARLTSRNAVESKTSRLNLASAIRARIAPLGGVELELPVREAGREPPTFD